MPFVHIQMVEGHSPEKKDEIAKRVSAAVSDVTGLPSDAVWVVVEDVKPQEWYVGGRSVKAIRAQPG